MLAPNKKPSLSVLVTGAAGYMGRFLVPFLKKEGFEVVALVRKITQTNQFLQAYATVIETGDLNHFDFDTLPVVSQIIHLAGRAHVMNERSENVYQAYLEGNLHLTQKLLKWAVSVGVRRFVYISSIKAVAEQSKQGPITTATECFPEDEYGKTKLLTEQEVMIQCSSHNVDYVIARPVLIYGTQLVGNLHSLGRLISKGFPLPFKGVENKRSLLSQEVFAKFLQAALLADFKVNKTFLVADPKSYSLPDIFTLIGNTLSLNTRLFFIPDFLLRGAFSIPGMSRYKRRLLNNLEVDAEPAHQFIRKVMEGSIVK